MRIFKRFLLYIAAVLLVVVTLSLLILIPWMNAPVDYHDQALRRQLAGQLDTLVIGQSYTMDSIIPGILDRKLGTSTYNLSGSLMPIYAQRFMAEKEIARNPIHYVLLEVTPDTFTNDETENYGNGDSYIIARLDSFGERLRYLREHVQLQDWPNVYARLMLLSLRSAVNGILGHPNSIVNEDRGFNPQRAKDVSLDPEIAPLVYLSSHIFGTERESNIREFESLIETCQKMGCEVILIYTTVSHAKVWQIYDQDEFRLWTQDLASKYNVPVFDFNLLRDRYSLFSDEYSFSDENHLSAEGAKVLSEAIADVLYRYRSGEDVSNLFFNTYWEAIQHSVYMQEEN